MLRALWEHRAFIASLVRREFQLRSIRALWGSAWLVIQPASQILIYTLIFGRVLGARLPDARGELAYGVYICSGILTWGFFSELVGRSQTLFIEHAQLLKTLRFPRSALPVTLLLVTSINFAIVAAIFLIVLAFIGAWPGAVLFTALPLLLLQTALGLGIGVLTGTVNVFFRDVAHVMSVILQFWFWMTPIVYPVSIAPEGMRRIFEWNPMFPIIAGYQRIAIEHAAPAWANLAPVALFAALLLLVSLAVFRALSPDLVDEL